MATNEVREALKSAAEKISEYVKNASEMKVETRYVEMGAPSFDDAKLAARTIVRLDGDSDSILPMRKIDDGTLVVDAAIYELHRQNVQAATEYRVAMMDKLLGLLRGQ